MLFLAWLTFLWLSWAGLLWGGFLLGAPTAVDGRRMPAWTRLGSSLALVIAAWSWYVIGRGSAISLLLLLVAAGMSLGISGDLFMARLLPVRQPVVGGMAAFGLGHMAYAGGWLYWSNQVGLVDPTLRWSAILAWLLIGGIGWYWVVYRGRRPDQKGASALHWAALPYALLLAGVAGVTLGLAAQSPLFAPLAVGASLFLVSDLILAARLFNDLRFPLVDDVIWLTYGPAQMLLVYSVGLAWRFSHDSWPGLPF
jgi:hypothetical protein